MAISRGNSRIRIQCVSMVAFLLSQSSVTALKTFTSCAHRVRRHHHTSSTITTSSFGGIPSSSAFATPQINYGNHLQRYSNNNLLLHRRSRIIQQQTACYATTNDGDITKLTVKELKDVLRI